VRTSTDVVRYCNHRRRILDEATRLKVRYIRFYRDYIAAWLYPILEFTFSQQCCVNSWILAQYGITRQEVEGVPELDWLQMLLASGCQLDAFAYLVEYEDPEKLLKFVERCDSNEDDFRLGTFQFDATLYVGRQIVTKMAFGAIAERCAIHCDVPLIISRSAFG
jgi:hypothetical protein